jgi:hypothetical protein
MFSMNNATHKNSLLEDTFEDPLYYFENKLDFCIKNKKKSNSKKNQGEFPHKQFWKQQLAKRLEETSDPITLASIDSLRRKEQKRAKNKRKSQKKIRF